mmetsp:Transcript_5873/g.7961  ORF Transcript_5873/g.7961 Transcript_5873/m.7961 type:complete len:117 (-) Transcript_5873:1040-1390(-)
MAAKGKQNMARISRNQYKPVDSRKSMSTLGLPSENGGRDSSRDGVGQGEGVSNSFTHGNSFYKNCFRSAKKINFGGNMTYQGELSPQCRKSQGKMVKSRHMLVMGSMKDEKRIYHE